MKMLHTSDCRARRFRTRLIGLGAALSVAVAAFGSPAFATGGAGSKSMTFKSPETAYEQGMGAWKSGFIEHAVPALRFAADHDVFLAKFYLARILADSGTAYTDHASAYRLYQQIGNDFADVDPDDDHRAPFVAKALTSLAGYVREGLPAAGVKIDPVRAVEILRHAAQVFNHEDAQFELAKMLLKGEGTAADPRAAMHWLSALTQRGHAGAQAFLADIYWRGRHEIPRDQLKAFALITVAVENASDTERIWIEDIYQNIFCGASSGTRNQAQGMVADWRQRYGRPALNTERYGLGGLPPKADRSCSNGERVMPLARDVRPMAATPAPGGSDSLGNLSSGFAAQPGPAFGGAGRGPMPGGMIGIGVTRNEPSR